eukprot:2758771-Pyramimonas_sp.AAC.1
MLPASEETERVMFNPMAPRLRDIELDEPYYTKLLKTELVELFLVPTMQQDTENTEMTFDATIGILKVYGDLMESFPLATTNVIGSITAGVRGVSFLASDDVALPYEETYQDRGLGNVGATLGQEGCMRAPR